MVDNYTAAVAMPAHIRHLVPDDPDCIHDWVQDCEWSALCQRCGMRTGLSSCKVCKAPIMVGELAQQHKSTGWKHARCQPKTARHLAKTTTEEKARADADSRKAGHHGRVVRGTRSL